MRGGISCLQEEIEGLSAFKLASLFACQFKQEFGDGELKASLTLDLNHEKSRSNQEAEEKILASRLLPDFRD